MTTVQIPQRIDAVKIEAPAYSPESILDFPRESSWPYPCFTNSMHGIEKRIVYIIRSDLDPSRHYVGLTSDLQARLK